MTQSTQDITALRQRMIDDMRMRKFAAKTQSHYIRAVIQFTRFLGASPDTATVEDLRRYQLHLVDRGTSPVSLNAAISALKFFFEITLNRADLMAKMHSVRIPRTLPVILSPEEVTRLIAAAENLKHQVALSLAYGAGLRASEVVSLKVGDIDSQRMTLRIQRGKGQKDRYAMLSPVMLEHARKKSAALSNVRWVEGETDEKVYVAGAFARTRVAGGEQLIGGVFLQDVYTPHRAWELVAGIRGDYWMSSNGFRRDTPPPAGVPPSQVFNDIERILVSPRVAALFHATPATDLRASAYQGFRVPTINELYRVFRVRNDVTAANESLRPERLTGGELGVQQRWGPVEARVTGFWNDVKDLIANVTLATRLADCPAGTTCRQRQNLDRVRIRGFETEVELRPAAEWRFLASYLFTDARVLEAPQQRSLEGNRLAQVPEHSVALGVRYQYPALFNASATARYVGGQFEDDTNTLPLGSYVVVDLALSRALAKWSEVFVGVENLFDTIYATGRTSEGVVSIGAPRLVRGGVRLTF